MGDEIDLRDVKADVEVVGEGGTGFGEGEASFWEVAKFDVAGTAHVGDGGVIGVDCFELINHFETFEDPFLLKESLGFDKELAVLIAFFLGEVLEIGDEGRLIGFLRGFGACFLREGEGGEGEED